MEKKLHHRSFFLFIRSFLFPTTKVKLIEDKERKTHNIILQVMRSNCTVVSKTWHGLKSPPTHTINPFHCMISCADVVLKNVQGWQEVEVAPPTRFPHLNSPHKKNTTTHKKKTAMMMSTDLPRPCLLRSYTHTHTPTPSCCCCCCSSTPTAVCSSLLFSKPHVFLLRSHWLAGCLFVVMSSFLFNHSGCLFVFICFYYCYINNHASTNYYYGLFEANCDVHY